MYKFCYIAKNKRSMTKKKGRHVTGSDFQIGWSKKVSQKIMLLSSSGLWRNRRRGKNNQS